MSHPQNVKVGDTLRLQHEIGETGRSGRFELENMERIRMFVGHSSDDAVDGLIANVSTDDDLEYDPETEEVEYVFSEQQTATEGQYEVEFLIEYDDSYPKERLTYPTSGFLTFTVNETLERGEDIEQIEQPGDLELTHLDVDSIDSSSEGPIALYTDIDANGQAIENVSNLTEQSDFDGLETDVQSNTQSIDGNETAIAENETAIGENENTISDLETDVESNTQSTSDNADSITDIEADKLDAIEYTPEDDTHDRYTDGEARGAVDEDVTASAGSVSEMDQAVSDLGDDVTTLDDEKLTETDYTPEADTHDPPTDGEIQTAVEGEVDVADLSGEQGSNGQFPVTDGTSVTWTNVEEGGAQSLNELDNVDVTGLLEGAYSDRPAASDVPDGLRYLATDRRIVFRSINDEWEPMFGLGSSDGPVEGGAYFEDLYGEWLTHATDLDRDVEIPEGRGAVVAEELTTTGEITGNGSLAVVPDMEDAVGNPLEKDLDAGGYQIKNVSEASVGALSADSVDSSEYLQDGEPADFGADSIVSPDEDEPEVGEEGDIWWPLVIFNGGDKEWSYNPTDSTVESISVDENNVYVGSGGADLGAADKETGSELWTFGSGRVYSDIAVDDDEGVIYVGSDKDEAYRLGKDSGDEEWSFGTGGSVRGGVISDDENVYIGSNDDSAYAIDKSDGSEVWQFSAGNSVNSGFEQDDDVIYIGGRDNSVYCLDKSDGSEVWEFSTGGSVDGEIAKDDDNVYFGSQDETFYAVEKDSGNEAWSFDLDDHSATNPVVDDQNVYFGTDEDDGSLYAVDTSDGSMVWAYDTGGVAVDGGLAMDEENVYFGTGWDYNWAIAVDKSDGSMVWEFETDSSVGSTFAIDNTHVYVGSQDHHAYRIVARDQTLYETPLVSDGENWIEKA